MTDLYFLEKSGLLYGHDSCGYVGSPFVAEIYGRSEADRRAAQCDEVRAVPISDRINSAGQIQEHIDRLVQMRDALSQAEPASVPASDQVKKPRLFYFDEGVDAWVPAPEPFRNAIDPEALDDGEEHSIMVKRFDMTDAELAALPEG